MTPTLQADQASNTASNTISEGKTKRLTPGTAPDYQPGELIVHFKDDATAFNAKKHEVIPGKGVLNAKISKHLFEALKQAGIASCYLRAGTQPNELVYQSLTMIPLEVVVRNYAYGSLAKRHKLTDGLPLKSPLVEFFHKTDDDPQISEDLIVAFGILNTDLPNAPHIKDQCPRETLEHIRQLALQINDVFLNIFAPRGIRVADFKLEFGWDKTGKLMLGDELSPDNFRLRDEKTGQVLDKDVFRLDLGDLKATYEELLRRLEALPNQALATKSALTYAVEVSVHSRKGIFSPESKAIQDGLHTMGYAGLNDLQAGKRFTFTLTAPDYSEAHQQVTALTDKLLANPVIEDYSIRIRQV